MSTRTQIWIMGTTAVVTSVQAAIWLTRVPPLWPVIVLGALAVLNAAGVVAAVVDDRRDRRRRSASAANL